MERKYREAICELLCHQHKTFLPRVHKVSTGLGTRPSHVEGLVPRLGFNKLLPACLIDAVSAQSALLYFIMLHRLRSSLPLKMGSVESRFLSTVHFMWYTSPVMTNYADIHDVASAVALVKDLYTMGKEHIQTNNIGLHMQEFL